MPILSNSRHERFCQIYTQGYSAAKAMEMAGYSYNPSNVTQLKRCKDIPQRIRELQEEMATKTIITKESLLEELEEARQVALAGGQASAMVAASRERAIISGNHVERTEQGLPGEFEGKTSTELMAYVADLLSDMGLELKDGSRLDPAGPDQDDALN